MARALVPASEAAEVLGVKRQTIYAYVSRGLLVSHRQPGSSRSLFDPAELDQLLRHGRGQGENPRPDVVIESALTRIDDDGHYYRGKAAVELAETTSFESVAEFLWTSPSDDSLPKTAAEIPTVSWNFEVDLEPIERVLSMFGSQLAPLDRIRVLLPTLAAADPMRSDLRPQAVASLARELLPTLFCAAAYSADLLAQFTRSSTLNAAQIALAAVGGDPNNQPAVHAVNQLLVLMADHELAASTSAVRFAASFGADPYASLQAGYAVISGPLHGAASTLVEGFLADVVAAGDAAAVVGRRLGAGERLPGIGHPIYKGGDPRFASVFELLRRTHPQSEAVQGAEASISLTRQRGLPEPNVDFAIAALAHASGWNKGAGEVLFALARSAGWIGHAIEEYTQRSNIRLRALYTGPRP